MNYTSYCVHCSKIKHGINNAMCLKNWGVCEDCVSSLKKNKKMLGEKDPFDFYRKMRRYDEIVDKK